MIKSARRTLADEPFKAAAALVSVGSIIALVAMVMAPWLRDTTTFGFHDWDVQTSHRELVRRTILRYHELPYWNPYACGGFPAWGYVEGGTIVVSPLLPAYLALPMSLAIRVEVALMAALSALGAWLLASRFTTSYVARALVVVLWSVNGRWALQTAAGHTWHLAYAWMPISLYFFERALAPDRKVRDYAFGAASIAMLVYSGGIYPLPHTVLALGLYAAARAIADRSVRPLVTLAVIGLAGMGLSAPKLFPLLDGFGKAPRLIASTESLEVGSFWTLLTSRDQAFYSRPARVSPYGWHEWGMYISTAGALTLALALAIVPGRREAAFKVLGLVFLVLGFGAFHPSAPWVWLHNNAPVFKSQHVPSRFLYPAVLFFGVVAASGLGALLVKLRPKAPWVELLAAVALAYLAVDVGRVAQKPMTGSMWMVPPDVIPDRRAFHSEQRSPLQYKRRDWAEPLYLPMLANTGVLDCYGTPPFDRRGAEPVSSPRYRGEAFVEGGAGSVAIKAWSPNHVTLTVKGAEGGATVVYNMNFDEGWHSSGAGPVFSHKNAVAVKVAAGDSTVELRYRAPYVGHGVLFFGLTVVAFLWARRREQEMS